MATYQITTPDGGTYEVTAPDTASHDEVLNYAKSMAPKAQPKQADANIPDTLQLGLPGVAKTLDTGIPLPKALGAFLVGGGEAATRIGQGIRQMLPGDNTQLDQQVANEKSTYAPLAKEHPWATGFGEALPAAAIPVGAAASIPAAIGRAAAANAIPAALQYGSAEQRAMNAGMAGLAGGVGAGAAYGVGRLINPVRGANQLATNETRALADAAGVKLTPAQATGSNVLSSLDGTLATLPGSAGKMAKIQQAQREGFNRAATSMLGEPPATSIANDAATIAKQGIGGRIEQAAAGVKIPVDDALMNDLAAVEAKYSKNLTPDQRPIVGQYINDILGEGGAFDGASYQAWRSRIGARAAGTQDSELKGALKGVQGALDNAFFRSAPADQAQAMTAARGQYRNFKTLEPLIEKAAMSSSNIPPAQVMSRALASKNTTPGMQNLAQLGQAIGRDYPNSGTVPRMFWMNALQNPLSIPLMGPMAGTAWATAQAVHSPMGRAYLTNKLISPKIEEILMRSGGLLGLGGAGGAGLLR